MDFLIVIIILSVVSGNFIKLFDYLDDYRFEIFSNLINKNKSPQLPKISKEEFKDLYVGKIAVHCSTRKSAEVFLKLADKFGYTWVTGDAFVIRTNWKLNRENTVYYVYIGQCGHIKNAKTEGYKIVEFKI